MVRCLIWQVNMADAVSIRDNDSGPLTMFTSLIELKLITWKLTLTTTGLLSEKRTALINIQQSHNTHFLFSPVRFQQQQLALSNF